MKLLLALGLLCAGAGTFPSLAAPKPDGDSLKAPNTATAIAQNSNPSKADRSSVQLTATESGASANATPSNNAGVVVSQPEAAESFASAFSGPGVLVTLGFGILGLLVVRKVRSRPATVQRGQVADNHQSAKPFDFGAAKGHQNSSTLNTRKSANHLAVATTDSLIGAYRIDQEVGKLVLGQPHRTVVLSSRAPDDRRAVEASLIRIVVSSVDEKERQRAREALEGYGFVARECATLLMAPDAFARTTAARSLGEIKSEAALPFLLEGLYDNEAIVRNQAVVSIGELKVPRAIGALQDMARRHPDVPGSLVKKALSACSVEGLDNFEAIARQGQHGDGTADRFCHDITKLEPASLVEDLPEDRDEPGLVDALAKVQSADMTERLEATKNLSRYEVRSAVNALTAVGRFDVEPTLRAQAISSLASINHESVFPAVLIGMADESREVRAAAARSLSHLSFDRADAYVRVMETTDEKTLPDVASACVKGGIVAQGIERLASSDRRQVYEAYSILSLLAKAKMTEPIIDAIANHSNLDIRLTAIRLLANSGSTEVLDELRELAGTAGVCEELRTALLQAMYQLDQITTGNEVAVTDATPTEATPSEPRGEPSVETVDSDPESVADAHEVED